MKAKTASTIRLAGFWLFLAVATLAAFVATGEVFASLVVSPHPMRLIRPLMTKTGPQGPTWTANDDDQTKSDDNYFNSWGLRDRERFVVRPSNVGFRSVFVGDSFLEGQNTRAALAGRIEALWTAGGHGNAEAINLGVSATGPRQYFYRIERFALDLKPDLVLMMFYSGNDFVPQRFGDALVPPRIDELPLPSLLGAVAPRTTWVLVDRLRLSEAARRVKRIPNECETLNELTDRPAGERTDGFVSHMRRFYYPNISDATLREVLSRGGDSFWSTFRRASSDRQVVTGALLDSILDWELGTWPVPVNAEDAKKTLDVALVDTTLTWLSAARRLVESHGVKFVIAMAPTGAVDPVYVDAWKAWPRYYSYSVTSNARHVRIASLLQAHGFRVIDLREDLEGVPDTYRIGDGHWNERGHRIAATRLARELRK